MALGMLDHAWNYRKCVNKKKPFEIELQQCQLALLQLACGCDYDSDNDNVVSGEHDVSQASTDQSALYTSSCNTDTAEFYGLLKSRFECADFKKKLENVQTSCPQDMAEEDNSWDMVIQKYLRGGGIDELETEDYVLV